MEVVAENSPIEIEARSWLNEHKAETGLSWTQLAIKTAINSSTLSLFAGGKYGGRNDDYALKVIAYRDSLALQAEIEAEAPEVPTWFDTPSASHMTKMLRWAQSGRMVMIVTSPGLGKTKVARRFVETGPNIWLATMAPSTAGVATMAIEVSSALGLGEVKGSPQQLSRQIKSKIGGTRGLLIVDEAQELTDKALNELRGWHDATGVGIALLGNERVVGQLNGHKSALAQVSSRISIPHVQMQPMAGDLEALFGAWNVQDAAQRAFLTKVGNLPGALREVTMTLEVALIAAGSVQSLTVDHLRAAAKQRNVKLSGL